MHTRRRNPGDEDLRRLERAYAADPTPIAAAQLALALERAGRLVDAYLLRWRAGLRVPRAELRDRLRTTDACFYRYAPPEPCRHRLEDGGHPIVLVEPGVDLGTRGQPTHRRAPPGTIAEAGYYDPRIRLRYGMVELARGQNPLLDEFLMTWWNPTQRVFLEGGCSSPPRDGEDTYEGAVDRTDRFKADLLLVLDAHHALGWPLGDVFAW